MIPWNLALAILRGWTENIFYRLFECCNRGISLDMNICTIEISFKWSGRKANCKWNAVQRITDSQCMIQNRNRMPTNLNARQPTNTTSTDAEAIKYSRPIACFVWLNNGSINPSKEFPFRAPSRFQSTKKKKRLVNQNARKSEPFSTPETEISWTTKHWEAAGESCRFTVFKARHE